MVHANAEVEKILTTKRKRGEYNPYDSEQRAKMARYAVEHGVARAAKHFSWKLSKNVNESMQKMCLSLMLKVLLMNILLTVRTRKRCAYLTCLLRTERIHSKTS
jgi:hypothetical protein